MEGKRAIYLFDHFTAGRIQGQEFGLNDIPDNLLVNAEILMGQNISQSRNFLPFNSGN